MKKITLTIDDESLLLLKELANENKTSVSQMVRRLVLEESKRNKVD